MNLSTPALLFGSISLLFLAYTNRFTVLAGFIRELYGNKKDYEHTQVNLQIPILRKRLQLVKQMQLFGVLSFILCTGSLFSVFLQHQLIGKLFFTVSILSLLLSLVFVLWEVSISTKALDLLLDNMHKRKTFKNEKTNHK